ncbi:hypothetical protein [Mycobacterium asiaticum]|uniref:Uncharacterized protein n=1 Tax=Mycobacterium asiaticum TaxID=1790 RepID=A0A1A3NYY5_MYCAS|nr:hypothetical protein [Mycobacterium asiaticum]OBK26229.1 hypothetical protein A5635_13785 [Mycobacterium asiaticum]
MVLRSFATVLGLVGFAAGIGMPVAAADNPVCSSTSCSFYAPSHNLGCEINYQRGSGIPDETYCQTVEPAQSVHMSSNGSFETCMGQNCLGNAGQGTATLPYGQSAGIGPFTCLSETNGVTCTVKNGRGFTISSSGVVAVG